MEQDDPALVRAPSSLLGEMARFGLVGLISNVLYFAGLWLFRTLAWPWWLAGAAAYALSMVANYLLQRTFTFRSQRSHLEATQRYVLAQATGLSINSVLLELLLGRGVADVLLGPFAAIVVPLAPLPALPVRVLFGQGFAVAVNSAFSYLAQKLWVFREEV